MSREFRDENGDLQKSGSHNQSVQELAKYSCTLYNHVWVFCCICRCCRIYLVHCDDVIAALERVVKVAIPEIVEGGRDTCSNTLPILTKYANQVHPTNILLLCE